MIPSKAKEYKIAKGPKKWVLWVVISISVLIAMFALYWRARQRQREIARLRNESELATLKIAQIRHEIQRSENTGKLIELVGEVNALQHSATAKRKEIIENEKILAEELKQVKALKSWQDLDAHNQQSR